MIGLSRHAALLCAVTVVVVAGCSSNNASNGTSQVDPQELAFREAADMIRSATKPDGRGPSGVDDFGKAEGALGAGYRALKSGDVVVIWGAGIKGEGEASSGGEIVAYEKDAPTKGGFVLFNGGDVKKLSASEFNSTPKAAGKK